LKFRYTYILIFISVTGFTQTDITGSFLYKDTLRDYIVHLPPAYTPGVDFPLVFNLHGLGSNAVQQQLYSQFDAVADTAGFIIVYPNAIGGVWDTVFPNSPIDDVGFISALIDTLDANYSIDTNRVYATGMSMGSYMSYRLACELNDRIAAIGSVAGLMTENFFFYCDPVPAMPVLHIHGTADSTILYQGDIQFNAPVDSLIQYWVQKNNCPLSPVVTQLPDIDSTDSCTVTKSYYGPCQDSTEVVLYTINNGGHTWPGTFPWPSFGNTNQDINASVEIWNFFKRHRLNRSTSTRIKNELNLDQINLTIFPNPFSDNINVKTNTLRECNIVVYNLLGEKVIEMHLNKSEKDNSGDFNLPAGHLGKGVYFLRIETHNSSSGFKIIKL